MKTPEVDDAKLATRHEDVLAYPPGPEAFNALQTITSDARHGGNLCCSSDDLSSDEELLEWVDSDEEMAGSRARTGHSAVLESRPAASQRRSSARLPDDLDVWEGRNLSMDTSVRSAMRRGAEKQMEGRLRARDRSDRATTELVLDPRTRMVLFKMLNSGVFCELHGCISTGKEANVYHAVAEGGLDLAVKVYKTSILVFKDRERHGIKKFSTTGHRYVAGDPRFRSYSKSNPRKMVKMWAEKEMRNLARLHAAGVPCPRPVQLRTHVLVMEFIGVDGVAALRLKDARLPLSRLQSLYTEMVLLIRKLYQECRLVHGDLSEYNLLVNRGELFVIDVSQAVDLDHPLAFDLLREDAAHVNAFFARMGVAPLTTRELFDFATDPGITAANLDATLDRLSAAAASRPGGAAAAEAATADKVFSKTHIPRALGEVEDYEHDFDRLAAGVGAEGIYYQTLAGMKRDMTGAREGPACEEVGTMGTVSHEGVEKNMTSDPIMTSTDRSEKACDAIDVDGLSGSNNSQSSFESSSGSDVSERAGSWDKRDSESTLDKIAQKAARKQHKRDVKEANRERRKTKLPKHLKKKQLAKGRKRH